MTAPTSQPSPLATRLRVGTKVETRMLGVTVQTVILESKPAGRGRYRYLVEIPNYIEGLAKLDALERAYVARCRRADGGFWFYGSLLEAK
jgi:hypothetical protein